MKRLAIITTHPIQYNAPFFRLISERRKIGVKVFYTWSHSQDMNIYDPGFKINKAWDIPLLQGYDYVFSKNTSSAPGSHHFKGIINPALVKEISNYEPDAILVYGWSFQSHLRVLRYFKGKIPLLFRGDSTLIDDAGKSFLKKKLRGLFLKWVYSHIDLAFYVGRKNKDYYKAFGLKDDQLVFMPHAIDNKRFSSASENTERELREMMRLTHDKMVFMFAGKLEKKKDPEILISAFLEVHTSSASLVLVGNGELDSQLKATYEKVGNVHFLPFQNQSVMPTIYSLADVFVLPSIGPGETWGLAVNEAMAAGKVVVVSDKCGCCTDLVEEGKNGFIFKAGNKADLVQKLQQLSSMTKEEIIAMGKKSFEKISGWSYDVAAVALENAINK